MKKQTKKQTAAKRPTAKPKAKPKAVKPKAKSNAKPRAKPVAKPTAKPKVAPKKSKPVVAKKSPTTAKPTGKPKRAKPIVEPITAVVPITALPAPVIKPDCQFELDELRRIELVLAEAENAVAGIAPPTVKLIPPGLTTEVTELLDELIVTASPRAVSTVSRLAYVLSGVMPGLQAVSERADIVLCRKNGVTFGWDRRAEEERAVRSGKRQKCITVS
jgi:hypothetical protein